jgi:hypothetical protein
MKQYDSIEYYGDYWGLPVVAFDKLDGSNLRFEFSQKRGFYKFGTRRQMIDHNSEYWFAIELFLNKYGEELKKIFKSKDYRNILNFVCYAELIGTRSQFGSHDFENDKFDVILFDIDQYKKGMVPPRQFIEDFGALGIPRVVYEGNLNKEFVQRVRNNEFDLSEGVICKGIAHEKKGFNQFYYCKIKTTDWFQRLREKDIVQYELEINSLKIDVSAEV